MSTPNPLSSASLADLLTATKNIVVALNNQTQNELNLAGAVTVCGIAAPMVLKLTAGRVANVSVTTAGSAVGHIYDSPILGATTKPLYIIPDAVALAPYKVEMPVSFGILVVPGSGQVLAVSYS